ncbi:unnamed protein product [Amoebophrya sp. A120]|nr:unnamed protein product [Amoebophrya sp. A120]|eukprot:GSA120T00015178001.1
MFFRITKMFFRFFVSHVLRAYALPLPTSTATSRGSTLVFLLSSCATLQTANSGSLAIKSSARNKERRYENALEWDFYLALSRTRDDEGDKQEQKLMSGKQLEALSSHIDFASRNPILFIGGMGASIIEATLNKTTAPREFCWKTAENYRVWLPYTGLLPGFADCFLDNFKLHWRDEVVEEDTEDQVQGGGGRIARSDRSDTNLMRQESRSSASRGGLAPSMFSKKRRTSSLVLDESEVQAYALGDRIAPGTGGLTDGLVKGLWEDLAKVATDSGKYAKDINPKQINLLTYDFRKSPTEWIRDGTFARTKRRIELYVDTYNAGKAAVLVTLSEGSNFLHQFLALYVDAQWKSQYVRHWLSLSGPFGGTPELTRMAFYPQPVDVYHLPQLLFYIKLRELRDVSITFPSTLVGTPTYLTATETLVVDHTGKKYTKNDLAEAFQDAGQNFTAKLLKMQKQYFFDALPGPGVPVTCVYGSGLPTLANMTYGNGWDQEGTEFGYESGDSVVPVRSLIRCHEWNEIPRHPSVELVEVPQASHGDTLRRPEALHAFREILQALDSSAAALQEHDVKVPADVVDYKERGPRGTEPAARSDIEGAHGRTDHDAEEELYYI